MSSKITAFEMIPPVTARVILQCPLHRPSRDLDHQQPGLKRVNDYFNSHATKLLNTHDESADDKFLI